MPEGSVLIVDDEKNIRSVIKKHLESAGYDVFTADKLKSIGKFNDMDIVLLDVRLPDADGIESIRKVRKLFPCCEVIVITAYEKDAQSAVKAMKNGAFDYLVKPFKLNELSLTIESALEKVALKKENEELRNTINSMKKGFYSMVGLSSEMQIVYQQMKKVAGANIAVLIEGESGTGKELCAETIHKLSKRKGRFVAINCAAIPENLLESELFGYKKGAFSGALESKKGLLEEAEGGSLFLDEIGDMPLELQSKLLRFLENFELRRLGDNISKNVDVRIISATNRSLVSLVEEKKFRKDLFYRLSGFVIRIPPLRNRKEDIPLLVKHILNKTDDKKEYSIMSQALKTLLVYDFPGNVRELKNILNQAAIMSGGTIKYEDLPEYIKSLKYNELVEGGSLDEKVENYERRILVDALEKAKGNKTKAAELLGITFRSLRYKVKKYNIEN